MLDRKNKIPRILVVEDDSAWRIELAMMYCRILRKVSRRSRGAIEACRSCEHAPECIGGSPRETPQPNLHDNIRMAADGIGAIQQLKVSRRDQHNGGSNFDILSLDIRLDPDVNDGERRGATGLDVLNAAVTGGRRIAVIAITGYRDDAILREQLGEREYGSLYAMRHELQARSGGECEVYEKGEKDLHGTVREQVTKIERTLNRERLEQMVEKTANRGAGMAGKSLCLHFILPDADGEFADRDWISISPTYYEQLNSICPWTGIFRRAEDEEDALDQLPARLMYLVDPVRVPLYLSFQSDKQKPAKKLTEVDLTPTEKLLLIRLCTKELRERYIKGADVDGLQVLGFVDPAANPWKGKYPQGDLSPRVRDKGKKRTPDPKYIHSLKRFFGRTFHDGDVILTNDGEYSLTLDTQVFIHRASAHGFQDRSQSLAVRQTRQCGDNIT